MITKKLLNQLKEASAKATKGPWVFEVDKHHGTEFGPSEGFVLGRVFTGVKMKSDAEFVALARNHIDSLIDTLEFAIKTHDDHVALCLNRNKIVTDLTSELAEQCRINGMGAQRELKLQTRVEELEDKFLKLSNGSVFLKLNHKVDLLTAENAQMREISQRRGLENVKLREALQFYASYSEEFIGQELGDRSQDVPFGSKARSCLASLTTNEVKGDGNERR